MNKTKIIIGVVIAAIIAAIIGWSMVGQDYVTTMIGTLVKQEVTLIMEPYNIQKKENDKKITALSGKVKKLEGKINENKPPVTSDELRDRFRELGYPAVK